MASKVLTIIKKISEIISENDDQKVILDRIADCLSVNLDSEVCSIYLHDEKSDELVLEATCGLNKASVGKIRLKAGDGITGHSFKQREIINISNPEKHPSFVFFKNSGEEKFKSFLSLPLVAAGRCVGVLNIQRISDKRFPPSVVDVVKSICIQLANLLLTSRMLEDLEAEPEPEEKAASREQKIIRGMSVTPGIAVGHAVIIQTEDALKEIPEGSCTSPTKELIVLENALRAAKKETVELEQKAVSLISEADASIFNVHLMFLEDKMVTDFIRRKIEDGFTLEYSLRLAYEEYQARFSRMPDPVFREKAADLEDVFLRLLRIVRAHKGAQEAVREDNGIDRQIIVAEELLPSVLIRLPLDKIAGIACEKGGATAHIAILAKSLDIPLLMGVSGIMSETAEGDSLILDCHSEIAYVRPAPHVSERFMEAQRHVLQVESEIDRRPASTADGRRIPVRANISLVSETSMLPKYGAEGIGLYRTEFLFMIRDHMPSEDVQSRVYLKICKSTRGEPVTIRVLDIGAEKSLPYVDLPHEDNPALGWRGVRVLLSKRDLFKSQLRAILTSSAGADIRILFPMVSVSSEVLAIRQILSEVEHELHTAKIPHNEKYSTGIMIEVPSAVIALDELIRYADFMSIGSNDLFQYTFAADRTNVHVAGFIKPFHPAFLKMLGQIGETFSKYPGKTLSLCGELAGNPYATPFLVGAGIHELSMSFSQMAAVKKVIRSMTMAECRRMLAEAVSFDNPESVICLVKQKLADKNLHDLYKV